MPGAQADSHFTLTEDPAAARADRSRPIYFDGHGMVDTPVLAWAGMAAGAEKEGPAIVESAFTTIVVDPAARFRRTNDGALLIEV